MCEDLTSGPVAPRPSPELADWKATLRRDFERWLEGLDAIPASAADGAEPALQADLYSFYAELAALTTETRKSNRRTVEAISQWNDVLGLFHTDLGRLRQALDRELQSKTDAVPRAHCLALVDALDRVDRLAAAFRSPPARLWWANDKVWRQPWESQRQAVEILRGHLAALLKEEGIAAIPVRGQPFDSGTMTAVATHPSEVHPPQTVIEEFVPGYRRGDEVLRLAQVKVTVRP